MEDVKVDKSKVFYRGGSHSNLNGISNFLESSLEKIGENVSS